jgi:ribosomal protein S18 acetylase RimI-like enzyme
MSEITVRPAEPKDLKQVQDLNYQLFLSDTRHFDDLNTNWPYEEGEKYFRERIAGKNGICFVAEKAGHIVGYVIGGWSHLNFSAYKGKRAELENICVSEKERSQGVGALLVDALFEWSKRNGATHVMVDAYAPNFRAIQFYEKQGFKPYSNVLWHEL